MAHQSLPPQSHKLEANERSDIFHRSGEWGVMPFHWYFTSALPRALLGAYPLAALGLIWEPRIRPYVMLTVAYITLYSFLPHKEVSLCLRLQFQACPQHDRLAQPI